MKITVSGVMKTQMWAHSTYGEIESVWVLTGVAGNRNFIAWVVSGWDTDIPSRPIPSKPTVSEVRWVCLDTRRLEVTTIEMTESECDSVSEKLDELIEAEEINLYSINS